MILELQNPSWPNNIKKAHTELLKELGNKVDPKNRNCHILSTFYHQFSDETTKKCANFVGSLLVLNLSIVFYSYFRFV